MVKKLNLLNLLLVFILCICIILIFLENGFFIQGFAVEGDVYSNVTISKYLSIEFSPELSNGIVFGNVTFLPVISINASENYGGSSDSSNYYIQVSSDGNTAVDFCINANVALTNQYLDVLGLDNETYSCSNESNLSLPSLSGETPLTLGFVKCGESIAPSSNNYYRFWLDIPAAQPSGDYNNTLSFKGLSSGVSC